MAPQDVQGFRLSPQQERLWLLQEADPGMPRRARAMFSITGPSTAEMLEAALRSVVRRHEVLRTWFFKAPGMTLPLQVVKGEDAALRLERVDLEAYDLNGVEGRLDPLFRSLGRSPEGAESADSDAGLWAA